VKESLLLNNCTKIVKSDRLFYDRFEYCFAFRQEEAGALRRLTHQYVSSALELRRTWIKMRYKSTVYSPPYSVAAMDSELEAKLHDMCDFLASIKPEHKIVIICNEIRIYLNDINLIQSWDADPRFKYPQITQSVVVRPKNTIGLRNPQHKFRVYFRSVHMTDAEKNSIKNFLYSQQEYIRLGPSLANWLLNKWLWTTETFFVDYDSEQWLLMLAMVRPGLTRKTMEIIKTK
jgi:hypothetical protein